MAPYPRGVTEWLEALLPSIGVLGLFVLALRAVIHADRRERDAVKQFEAGVADPVRPQEVPEDAPGAESR